MRTRERGVALITAMLIVAIVAALATSIALGQQVWLRQTQNLADLIQAERLRQGALEGAALLLAFDAKNPQSKDVDHLGEEWASSLKPAAIESGMALMKISDAQARFNLNNLARVQAPAAGASAGAPSSGIGPYRSIYERLLTQNGLGPELIESLLDWLDEDSDTKPNGGAEDLDYLNAKTPYRAGNNKELKSVDELLLIKGYTREAVDKLRPYLIVLPAAAGATPINVNTAEAPVLAALANLTLPQAEQIVNERKTAPFKNKDAVKQHPLFAGNQVLASAADTYDVKSGYFIVAVTTLAGRTQRSTEALIERPSDGNKVQVLWYRYPPINIVVDEDKS